MKSRKKSAISRITPGSLVGADEGDDESVVLVMVAMTVARWGVLRR